MAENTKIIAKRPLVIIWLLLVCCLVFALIIVGGITRLTDSGLSITEWEPIIGILPPLNDMQWLEAFEKYKLIPEYRWQNRGMTLSEFQFIYYWEWGHRFLARFIGLALFFPWLIFALAGWVQRRLLWQLFAIVLLVGLQGAIGWWMVASGLTERVDVSQYRLAVHLMMACLILALLVWLVTGLIGQGYHPTTTSKMGAIWLLGLLSLQIFLGALVAGLRAGLTYNEWPWMDGMLMPPGLFDLSPLWRNFFDSIILTQFQHRWFAVLVVGYALIYAMRQIKTDNISPAYKKLAVLIAVLCLGQFILGVFTLLEGVPLVLGVAHQTLAMLLLIAAVVNLRFMYRFG